MPFSGIDAWSKLVDEPVFFAFMLRKTFLPLNLPTIGEKSDCFLYETASVAVFISVRTGKIGLGLPSLIIFF